MFVVPVETEDGYFSWCDDDPHDHIPIRYW